MKKYVFLILIAFACKKEGEEKIVPDTKSAEKDISSFSISFKSFSGREIESKAKIDGNKISIYLPPNYDAQNVKPNFEISKKAIVQVGDQTQQSGSSVVNLSKSVTYQVVAEDKSTKNYEVTAISIDQDIDRIVEKFKNDYNVTGLTFAMSKNEKLIYAKGYGLANKSTNEAVTVNSLFRIASVSKPITAIAIMKLVEDGKLSLDSKVFGENAILGTKYGNKPYRANYDKITIKQILEHTSGLATNDDNDPMFSNINFSQETIINNTLNNNNLLFVPGSQYKYSNFGYCVLGRVIEKITEKSYINYLQDAILKPSGITTIQLTSNAPEKRKSGEVMYYEPTYNTYSINVERMDAHGGLIASSIDLVKLLSKVDGFKNKEDILKSETINTMTKYNANTSYSLGWSVNSINHWWHTGQIIGTNSMMVRANNGFSWAIIVNSNCVTCNNKFNSDIDELGWNIQTAITNKIPDYDLF